ncbi:hypothetical protein [Sulfurisphaera ohwakuensis]|uniref:Flagellin n=1 Tax=Sulfurisphaera ohwakuensis TaxID=69656 RepID=A0A650CG73_SULOH|nr:hypothetical protein [Sulfurisphaera ohwakuensis]MBB5254093.1 hypothetical protein [Sulfurisphaera ohwakuensis]QGR16685.1 hypothetical protein D1869_05415 [Sulfurisphaera ohwakuensis]
MAEGIVTTFMIVIAVLVIGLVIFGFSSALLAPKEAFAIAQHQAAQLASQTTISVGPFLVSNSQGSLVIEAYDPSYSGNYYVYVFLIPSYLITSAGVVTPNDQFAVNLPFQVYLANGNLATQTTITSVYDINGNELYQGSLSVYEIPSNTPVTINIQNVPNSGNGYYIIVWLIYTNGINSFRIGYAYTGLPGVT